MILLECFFLLLSRQTFCASFLVIEGLVVKLHDVEKLTEIALDVSASILLHLR